MNEKPILFSGEMVRAILDGRKVMTRRVMKPQPNLADGKWRFNGRTWEKHLGYPIGHDVPLSPYGRPGDLLWVRETWGVGMPYHHWKPSQIPQSAHIEYRATSKVADTFHAWKPSIFMPRWASRLTLRVTAVKVERVQDITTGDAIMEGCPADMWDGGQPLDWFSVLWDSVNSKRGYSWDSNPWVWVVEFERVD